MLYFLQGFISLVATIVLPFLFGFAVMKRFGGLRGAQLWAELLDRAYKIALNFFLYSGLPVLAYYWQHHGHPDYQTLWLLHPLLLSWAAMLAGAYWRMVEYRWEQAAPGPGWWTQYRF